MRFSVALPRIEDRGMEMAQDRSVLRALGSERPMSTSGHLFADMMWVLIISHKNLHNRKNILVAGS